MRQSQYLTRALEAAAEVLSSDSQDLKELADQAEAISGIPARRILMNIDLTGINLAGKQIDYLTDREARYHNAHITDEQRLKFQKGERELRTRKMHKKIRSIRVELILDFVETFEDQGDSLRASRRSWILDASKLRKTLLFPLEKDYPADKPLDQTYAQHVLSELSPYATEENFSFFSELFGLLGDLQCEIGKDTCALIADQYYRIFGEEIGDLVRQLRPSATLDMLWIYGFPIHMALNGEIVHRGHVSLDTFFSSIIRRAQQINKHRVIHARAVESVLDHLDDALQKLDFIEAVEFDCSIDEAERIALRIVKADWPASRTRQVLEAKVPAKVRGALFRQIIHQRNMERTLEMLRWLNNDRGAIGALSLDDALDRINSFAALFEFASDVHSNLSVNQLNVLRKALNRTAQTSAQRSKVRQLLSG